MGGGLKKKRNKQTLKTKEWLDVWLGWFGVRVERACRAQSGSKKKKRGKRREKGGR